MVKFVIGRGEGEQISLGGVVWRCWQTVLFWQAVSAW